MMSVIPVLCVLAQESAEVVTTQTLWSFLASGGPVMFPIGVCSVVVVAFAMERYLRLQRPLVCPKNTDRVLQLLRAGQFDEARALADNLRAPSGRILLAGLRRQGFAVEEVERVMEDQGQKELEKLRAPIRPVSLIGNIAPLMGLLGTVIGISEAFHRVVKTGMGKPENLAAGIEQALTTTIAGLVVAIPALLIAAHLGGRVRKLLLATDEKLAPAVELLARSAGENSDAA